MSKAISNPARCRAVVLGPRDRNRALEQPAQHEADQGRIRATNESKVTDGAVHPERLSNVFEIKFTSRASIHGHQFIPRLDSGLGSRTMRQDIANTEYPKGRGKGGEREAAKVVRAVPPPERGPRLENSASMSVIDDEPAVVEHTVADRAVFCRISEEALPFGPPP